MPVLHAPADDPCHQAIRGEDGMKPLMTPDASLALAQAGFSRRRFLKGAGALIVAFRVGDAFELAESAFAQGLNGVGNPQLDAWLAIAADGWVTACTGKCELGTGLFTAQ